MNWVRKVRHGFALASILTLAAFAPTAAGALAYRGTGIIVDEVRSPTGQSKFTLVEIGTRLPGERFINPLGESSKYPTDYDDWESVASRLFGEWKFVAKRGQAEEIHSFTISPFAYSDIVEPFPVFSLPHGARVASPFSVSIEKGSFGGGWDGSLPGGWVWTDVQDVRRQYLGEAGYKIEFGQAGQNARMLLSARSSGGAYPFVSAVAPPADPTYFVNVGLSIARVSQIEVLPFNVPEPSSLSLLVFGGALLSRRLRRPQG